MKLRLNKIYLLFPILVILYIINMKDMIHNVLIVFFINFVFYILYCIIGFIRKRTIDVIFECMIISMPISFISLTGGDYSKFPLSWFNIFYIIIILYVFLFKKVSYIPWLCAVVILGIIESLIGSDLRNAMNQFINIILYAFSFVIGKGYFCSKYYFIDKYIAYIKVIVFSFAITLICQYIMVQRGINVGVFDFLGGNRLSLGATFTDYSFASLFLFIGITVYLMHMGKRYSSKILNFCCILIIFIANFIVDARTGIVGFFIAVLIYMFIVIVRMKKKAFIIISACFVLPIILYSAIYISNSRSQSLFNGSGRIDTYKVGLEAFFQHPLSGVGLGLQNYKNMFHEFIPHNIIIQYLAQTGIIYTVLLLAPLFYCIFFSYKKNMMILLSLLTMFVGGMFIPDIFNSRFIILLIILFYCEKGRYERSFHENKNRNILTIT